MLFGKPTTRYATPSNEAEHRATVEDIQEAIADLEEEEPLTGINHDDDESSKSSKE